MRAADPEWVSNPLRHAAGQGLGIGSPKSNNEPITKDTNPRHGKERKDNE